MVVLSPPLELSSKNEPCPSLCAACEARAISICRVLPHRELRQLSESAVLAEPEPGEAITFEGQPATHVFNITGGMVMLSKLLTDGRRQVLGLLLPGDFLGLQGGDIYGFTAQAVGRASVCRFPRPAFRRFLSETPDLEAELLRRASDELGCAQRHVTLLGRKTARERVATFLLDLAERAGKRGGSPDLVVLAMTRTDIADYLGLTTETVSRVFSALKRSGHIQLLAHGAVRIMRRKDLEALSEAA